MQYLHIMHKMQRKNCVFLLRLYYLYAKIIAR